MSQAGWDHEMVRARTMQIIREDFDDPDLIDLELSVAHINANLSRREADLVLRACLPDNPGLIARKLGTLAYAIYGEAAYVAANPAAYSDGRFTGCKWVGFDDDPQLFLEQQPLRKLARDGQPARVPRRRLDRRPRPLPLAGLQQSARFHGAGR